MYFVCVCNISVTPVPSLLWINVKLWTCVMQLSQKSTFLLFAGAAVDGPFEFLQTMDFLTHCLVLDVNTSCSPQAFNTDIGETKETNESPRSNKVDTNIFHIHSRAAMLQTVENCAHGNVNALLILRNFPFRRCTHHFLLPCGPNPGGSKAKSQPGL